MLVRRPYRFRDHSQHPTVIIHHLNICSWLAKTVQAGLTGTPFVWDDTNVDTYLSLLAGMGITIASHVYLQLHGYQLTRDAQPVGRIVVPAIPYTVAVYVVECQCVKATSEVQW